MKDEIPQDETTLMQLENDFGYLTGIIVHLNNMFSVYLGVNLFVWMFMTCAILYDSLTGTTTGYDAYIGLYILNIMSTLLVCSLVNGEVSLK